MGQSLCKVDEKKRRGPKSSAGAPPLKKKDRRVRDGGEVGQTGKKREVTAL